MAQVTIYIDNNLEENISSSWDNDTKYLEGSWSDFPTIEYTENTQVKDTKREEFRCIF